MKLGTTYSPRHAAAIGIDTASAFTDLLELEFDTIRLCCYWDELQPAKNAYAWNSIETLIQQCEKKNQEVVLTIGMKAPRWPEYYIPAWLSQNPANVPEAALLNFLKQVIRHLQKYSCIRTWQIENEAPDPSGPNAYAISQDTLEKEVNLARSLDTRPILLTLWGNEVIRRNFLQTSAILADIIGLDIYFRIPTKNPLRPFGGPHDSLDQIKKKINITKKPLWITELQAEPWESGVIFPDTSHPKSMNPMRMAEGYEKVKTLSPDVILLWGYEYWYWRRLHGDDSWWQAARNIVY